MSYISYVGLTIFETTTTDQKVSPMSQSNQEQNSFDSNGLGLPQDDGLLLPQDDGLLLQLSTDSDLSLAAENCCSRCGAPKEPEQNCCLDCGLSYRQSRTAPGLAALASAALLTLAFAGGATAAGVAALNDKTPPRQTEVKTVAQEAPTTEQDNLDQQPLDQQPLPPDSGSIDNPPLDNSYIEPGPVEPYTPVPNQDNNADKQKDKPSRELVAIELPGSAAAFYDPQNRFLSGGDPADAISGQKSPSWFVTTAEGDMNIGLQVDLGRLHKIKQLTMTTKTPGYTVSIFGSTEVDPPTDISQMTLLAEETKVGSESRSVKIKLDSTKKWRTMILWLTTPPSAGPTVHISQLKFLQLIRQTN